MKFNRFVLVSLAAAALLSGCGKSTSPTGVTSNNLDTTPPPTPDGMTVVVDSNSGRQQLVWSPSSAADLARYQVYIYSPDPSRDRRAFVISDHDGWRREAEGAIDNGLGRLGHGARRGGGDCRRRRHPAA